MGKSVLDDIAEFGAGFDWMTQLYRLMSGYGTVEYGPTLDYDGCKAREKQLKRAGVSCKTWFLNTSDGWVLVSRR